MRAKAPSAGLWRVGLLLLGNVGLALGPMFVRLADTGPVAAGFWRITLALPFVMLLAWRSATSEMRLSKASWMIVMGAGVLFALDLASWHLGIERTRLGNSALFGNSGSVILIAWSLIAARRMPLPAELASVLAALVGASLLMGGSLEISRENLVGDLLCLLAGVLYVAYILMLRHVRGRMGSWSLLAVSAATGVPVLYLCAVALGETIVPHDWTPLIALSLCSQILGQGVLIWALFWFRPLVIGLALLTQPAIAALTGWLVFDEALSPSDMVGMVLMAAALALARAAEPVPARG